MDKVGIIAAFSGELRPLVRGWQPLQIFGMERGEAAWEGTLGGVECVAVCAGMGQRAVTRACGLAQDFGPVSALISVGWAGALSCGVQPGTAYHLAEVIDAKTGERFPTGFEQDGRSPLRLVTTDHVVEAQEKRRLAETYRAVLVDMEAATVARLACGKGLEFYCVKTVSDAPGEKLPNFGQFTGAGGKLRFPALVAYLAARPDYWPGLVRIRKNTRAGAQVTAIAVKEFLENGIHADHSSY